MAPLKAPFPWFGGKSRAASLIWERFGEVRNYVEPFFGSGAVLLGRPQPFVGSETVNDKDGFVSNFWRAVADDPEAVARHADWPVNENDLHARHAWLVAQATDLQSRLEGDPDYYDAKVAGWWVYGLCLWIGTGFCSGKGPWQVVDRKLVHAGDAGRGIHRQLVHAGNAGMGIHRQLVHAGNAGMGEWFAALSDRLRRVRVCSGDWSRVVSDAVTLRHGLTGIVLDPPYATDNAVDYVGGDNGVAVEAREWAIKNGNNPLLRIALCGYQGEHDLPGWTTEKWKARKGYQKTATDGTHGGHREVIWFSPHCLGAQKRSLFEAAS